MPRDDLSLSGARRIALAAQGFDRARPARVDARHLRRAVQQLGLLQIDYVNVLGPAQYQVLFSRLGPYEKSRADDLLYRSGEFTEMWAHEASILPVESWPLFGHRREGRRVRPRGFEKFLEQNKRYVEWVLNEVRERGPLTAADLKEPEGMQRRRGTWWSRSIPQLVLEGHFGTGRVVITQRLPNFSREYDLTERVVPREHIHRKVGLEESQRELLRLAARAHGVGTARDLADYYRMSIREARLRIGELVESGELREVRVEGWRDPAFLQPQAKRPRRIDAAALLSPFDPVIWFRERAERLFGFEYRIEIYVPGPQRRWGYYVLPFLLGDRLVARVDLKADRKQGRLLVQAAHIEPSADPDEVAPALTTELRTLASWHGLDAVSVGRRGGFARPLAAAVRA